MPYSLFVEAVEQAPMAISITDKKANILYVNEAFSKVTGYQSTDILGENQSKLSDKTTPRHVYHDLWHTISARKYGEESCVTGINSVIAISLI